MRITLGLLILLIVAAVAYGSSIGHVAGIVAFTVMGIGTGTLIVTMLQRDWDRVLAALGAQPE